MKEIGKKIFLSPYIQVSPGYQLACISWRNQSHSYLENIQQNQRLCQD